MSRFRSSISGRFVSKLWAKLFPWIVVKHDARAAHDRVMRRYPKVMGRLAEHEWSERDLKIGGSE